MKQIEDNINMKNFWINEEDNLLHYADLTFPKLIEFFERFQGKNEVVNLAVKLKYKSLYGRKPYYVRYRIKYVRDKFEFYKNNFDPNKAKTMIEFLFDIMDLNKFVCIIDNEFKFNKNYFSKI